MGKQKTITIVGAGLSGCFMAILLAQKGYEVTIYEAYANPQLGAVDTGRSYNIQLYLRCIKALQKIGLWETIKKSTIKIEGYVNHLHDGEVNVTTLSNKKNEILYQIHRATLHTILLKKAQSLKNVTVHFDKKFIAANYATRSLYFLNAKTQQVETVYAEHVIGADGVHSAIRPFVQKRKDITYSQEVFPMACIEVTLSAKQTKSLELKPNITHRWPRENAMLIGFPNKDTSLTLMLTLPLTGKQSFATLKTEELVQRFVKNTYPDLQPVAELLAEGILHNPVGTFTSTQTSSWYEKDFIVLIGDAAHSMIPFYGQGVNSAFEDCLMLGNQLDKYDDYGKAFASFQRVRKPHTDTISKLAQENFYTLRDKTRSFTYLLREKVQTGLAMLFPTFFMPPLYKLIIYSVEPYGKVLEKYRHQQHVLKQVIITSGVLVLFIPYYVFTKLQKVKFAKLLNHPQPRSYFKQKATVLFLIRK